MTEKLKPSNESDERGVSPVLGVALLIGITVTLVAVVGIVVMGIGPTSAQAPSAKMAFTSVADSDSTTGPDIKVTHNGGDAIKEKNLVVKVDGSETTDTTLGTNELTAGDSFTVNDVATGSTVKIIWDNPSSDSTTVLAEYEV